VSDDDESVDVAYTGDKEERTGSKEQTDPEERIEPESPTDPDGPDEAAGSGDGGDSGSTEPDETSQESADPDDPFAELAGEIEGDAGFDEEAFAVGREGSDDASPFDELQADTNDVDPDELFEEMFVEQEAGDLDTESVWETLEGTEREGGKQDGGGLEGETSEGDEHVVSAREFCADCEHAAEPPEVRCTYEGSEIVEFVDKNTVRVRNCPIVARRNKLGEMN